MAFGFLAHGKFLRTRHDVFRHPYNSIAKMTDNNYK